MAAEARLRGEWICDLRLRIAFVELELNVFGGAERVLENIMKRLKEKNEISLFTASISPELAKLFASYGHFDTPESWRVRSRWGEFAFSRRLIEMAGDVSKWEPDVVVLNGDPMYERWLAAKTGRRTVVYAHDFFGPRQLVKLATPAGPGKNIGRWAYRRFVSPRRLWSENLGSAALVICVSRAVEQAYLKLNPNLRTAVINNGVDHELFFPTWVDEGYCLCISRYTRQKNLGLLTTAFNDSPYPIVIYGKPTTESQDEYFRSLKSSSSPSILFEIHENQERLRDVLQRCSIFLHPGKNEAFPLSPLEAMASGKVVVAHNSGGTPECVEGGGFLLGDDPKEWRSLVDDLMKSETRRKELGERALKHSMNFTWAKTTNQISGVLQSVLTR